MLWFLLAASLVLEELTDPRAELILLRLDCTMEVLEGPVEIWVSSELVALVLVFFNGPS